MINVATINSISVNPLVRRLALADLSGVFVTTPCI